MEIKLHRDGRKFTKGFYDPATGLIRNDHKGKVRYRIEKEVNDLYDLIADLSKRLDILEGETVSQDTLTKLNQRKSTIKQILQEENYYG